MKKRINRKISGYGELIELFGKFDGFCNYDVHGNPGGAFILDVRKSDGEPVKKYMIIREIDDFLIQDIKRGDKVSFTAYIFDDKKKVYFPEEIQVM